MIKYLPNMDSLLWSFKSIEYFDSYDDLKSFIADQRTRFLRFIGKIDKSFQPADVTLSDPLAPYPFIYWKNYRRVIIDNITVGFCGE